MDKMMEAMLRNQREKEEQSPSDVPLAGPWAIKATQWHLLDSRLSALDRPAVPANSAVTFLNKRDAYRTQREASNNAHAPLVCMRYAFPEGEFDGDGNEVEEEYFEEARVWPVP